MTWNRFKLRKLTDEEKELFPDDVEEVWGTPIPDDEEDVLVSDGERIWIDNWYHDGEGACLIEASETEGLYWMPLPKLP